MIYFELFYVFFTAGLFTFGGGYAMLPMIQQSVSAKGWLDAKQLLDFVAVSESTPGPFVVNLATYIGSQKGGIAGAAVAVAAVVLPSLVIISVISGFYKKFKENKYVAGAMTGLRPAVIGLIGYAVYTIGRKVYFADGFSLSVILTLPFAVTLFITVSMLVLLLKKVHPIAVIGISAALGIIAGFCGVIQ